MARRVLVTDAYVIPVRHYGFWAFVFDLVMLGLTGGWWIIWIIIRESRWRSL